MKATFSGDVSVRALLRDAQRSLQSSGAMLRDGTSWVDRLVGVRPPQTAAASNVWLQRKIAAHGFERAATRLERVAEQGGDLALEVGAAAKRASSIAEMVRPSATTASHAAEQLASHHVEAISTAVDDLVRGLRILLRA